MWTSDICGPRPGAAPDAIDRCRERQDKDVSENNGMDRIQLTLLELLRLSEDRKFVREVAYAHQAKTVPWLELVETLKQTAAIYGAHCARTPRPLRPRCHNPEVKSSRMRTQRLGS